MSYTIILSILTFTVAANLDNLGVCIAYGMSGTKVTHAANLMVAVISGVATGLSIAIGAVVAQAIENSAARLAGVLLMASLGGWIILKALVEGWRQPGQTEPCEVYKFSVRPLGLVISILAEPDKADLDHSKTIDMSEALWLGAALAINCLASGAALGLINLPIIATSLAVTAGSYLCTFIGWRLGKKASNRWVSNRAGILAGLLMVALAFFQLI
jgi:putative sporulation protein YtaF